MEWNGVMNVGFVSLGCSKNLVDTEMMIGVFKNNEFNIVWDPKEAEVIVVNTCGFIESAKEEAINTILEMAEYKKTGKCKILVVTGCLVERYKQELEKALPEVDIFLKYSDYAEEKGNSGKVFSKVLNLIYDKIENKKKEFKNYEEYIKLKPAEKKKVDEVFDGYIESFMEDIDELQASIENVNDIG